MTQYETEQSEVEYWVTLHGYLPCGARMSGTPVGTPRRCMPGVRTWLRGAVRCSKEALPPGRACTARTYLAYRLGMSVLINDSSRLYLDSSLIVSRVLTKGNPLE